MGTSFTCMYIYSVIEFVINIIIEYYSMLLRLQVIVLLKYVIILRTAVPAGTKFDIKKLAGRCVQLFFYW